jgi:hypothetical protein
MLIKFIRSRTSTVIVVCALYLSSWSQSTNKCIALQPFKEQKEIILPCGIEFDDLVHTVSITNREEFPLIID